MAGTDRDGSRVTVVLILLGLIALVTSAFELFPLKRSDFKEEVHRVVDAAQIWVVRPEARGGGGGSFDSLDFRKMGLSREPASLEWKGSEGLYRIAERSREWFILEYSGEEAGMDTIGFDTYPELE